MKLDIPTHWIVTSMVYHDASEYNWRNGWMRVRLSICFSHCLHQLFFSEFWPDLQRLGRSSDRHPNSGLVAFGRKIKSYYEDIYYIKTMKYDSNWFQSWRSSFLKLNIAMRQGFESRRSFSQLGLFVTSTNSVPRRGAPVDTVEQTSMTFDPLVSHKRSKLSLKLYSPCIVVFEIIWNVFRISSIEFDFDLIFEWFSCGFGSLICAKCRQEYVAAAIVASLLQV